ncbi:PaaI family thioesterase [Kitasatospora sp. NBC_00315]|uniref:PaaI family thioesterase n=1 Tax=Kitasatospora sp. NBC_00315 TaxID=2975963 RepID=UPI00324DB6F5
MTDAAPTDAAPVLDVPQDVLDHFAKLGVDPSTFSGGHLGDRLGIKVVEASGDRVVGTMPVEGNQQPYGLLHGGASAALAETLGSIGAMLHAGPGRYAVGVDLNATHHRSATSGTVTGVATAVFKGRTAATYEIAITDDTGRRITSCRLTCMLRDL